MATAKMIVPMWIEWVFDVVSSLPLLPHFYPTNLFIVIATPLLPLIF
jgi:hypothetical protein